MEARLASAIAADKVEVRGGIPADTWTEAV
jgi:hypothetical protein